MKTKYFKKQRGQILLLVLVVIATVLISVLLIIGGAQLYYRSASYTVDSEKALALAESGIDKAIVSLNRTGGSYTGDNEVILGDGSFSIKVTDKDASTKVIETEGYIPSKTNPKIRRSLKVEASKGIGIAFVYGVQVGEGGLELGNNNQIQGSVYSNGNVQAGNGNIVTGDVWVAGGPQSTSNQQTDCSGGNCSDYIFGKNVGGNNILDVAQSFRPTETNQLNKINIKVKKVGNPIDAVVRIMGDNSGSPDKNGVLATGYLYSSLVTNNFGWISVTFDTTPELIVGTSYWIMVDTSSDLNDYWVWQNDLAQSYSSGVAKWTSSWNQGNPTWNQVAGDLSFEIYMGGTPTSVRAGTIKMVVGGDAHANTIENLTVTGDAYYQAINSSLVGGTACPNSNCFPGSEDPPPKVFPISEANIESWRNQAMSTTLSAPICGSTWGPGKYNGTLNLNNTGCMITVKSPIWINGNLIIGNQITLKLDETYGTSSGIIVVDGQITLGNGNRLQGTGVGSSLLMALSTYDSRSNGIAAIDITNTANTGVFYANNGIIQPGNGNSYKELTAWGIRLANGTTLNYETGLASTLFSSGPGGSYTLIKGTYQVK
jgi:hypothetical protein